jgi:hypothetical protein
MFAQHDIEVCFLLQTKKEICPDSFASYLWNVNDVAWHALDSEGKSRGILAMWNNIYFKTETIGYGGQWVTLFGLHIQTSFKCAVVGVYGANSIASHRSLRLELKTLDATFSVLMFIVVDFNVTFNFRR